MTNVPAPAAEVPELNVYLPFLKMEKQDDGTLLVHTYLNDETVDDQGEIVDYEAIEKAAASYLEWGNLREMHRDDSAAGALVNLIPIPEERRHEAVYRVVDPVAVQKCETGVYKGTSLGGFKRRLRLQKGANGEQVRRITEIDWRETSLVDRPSRPSARLTLLKRSDPGAPAPLIIEEDEMSTPGSELAPEAGIDTYAGPDGQPLAKATEIATEPPVAPAAAPEAEAAPEADPLAKSASGDLWDANYAINVVASLLEREATEGEPEQVSALREALGALQRFAGSEAQEIGAPAEAGATAYVETVTTIVQSEVMEMASKGGDLAKPAEVAPLGREDIAAIVEEVLAKRSAQAAPAAAPEPETPADVDVEELLAKTARYIDDNLSRFASKADLQAMQATVLEVLAPLKEDMAKVARMPVPGGPVRFAVDRDRDGVSGDESPATEAAVLAKAAQSATDPHTKELLGRMAAEAKFRERG